MMTEGMEKRCNFQSRMRRSRAVYGRRAAWAGQYCDQLVSVTMIPAGYPKVGRSDGLQQCTKKKKVNRMVKKKKKESVRHPTPADVA
jgi:hypothetical protein